MALWRTLVLFLLLCLVCVYRIWGAIGRVMVISQVVHCSVLHISFYLADLKMLLLAHERSSYLFAWLLLLYRLCRNPLWLARASAAHRRHHLLPITPRPKQVGSNSWMAKYVVPRKAAPSTFWPARDYSVYLHLPPSILLRQVLL